MPLRRLAQDEGINQATLAKWHAQARAKGQFLPDTHAVSEGWTSRHKRGTVIETVMAAVIETVTETSPGNAADPGDYCRRRGVCPEQLHVRREACDRANA